MKTPRMSGMAEYRGLPTRQGRDFRVEDWLIQPDRCVIVNGSGEIHVRPKVMDLLVLLAERPGEVVSHEEILERVWGKEYLAESALPGAISELRSAFRDDTSNPRVIETIAKRGYRLVAQVRGVEDPAPRPSGKASALRAARFALLTLLAVAVAVVLATLSPWRTGSRERSAGGTQPLPRVVVVPFQSLGEPAESYFAAGINEELTSRLASLGGLTVIAGDSGAISQEATSNPVEVGRRLGADYILTGTIRWDSVEGHVSRARITPRLVAVADGTVVLSDVIDRSIDDIFVVQSEIASRVAERLGTLLPPSFPSRQAVPTPDPEAYRIYLRAREHETVYESSEDQFMAASLYQRVNEFDPSFVQGWVRSAIVNSRIFHLGYDRSMERRQAAERALARAVALDADDPEVQYANVVYDYFVRADYEKALAELAAAESRLPLSAGIFELRGYLLRRLGRWEEALEALRQQLSLVPGSSWNLCEIGITEIVLGRYEEADRDLQRSIDLAPDQHTAYEWKAHNALLWKRSTSAARAELERMPDLPRTGPALESWLLAVCERRYEDAMRALGPILASGSAHRWYFYPRGLLEGQVYQLMGEDDRARQAFDEARIALEARLNASPDDFRAHSALGLAYAGLGRREDAVRHGELAVRLFPIERDAVRGGFCLEALARIHLLTGDQDAAVTVLEQLLSNRVYPQAIPLLDLDPRWEPLHTHPRYAELVRMRPSAGRS